MRREVFDRASCVVGTLLLAVCGAGLTAQAPVEPPPMPGVSADSDALLQGSREIVNKQPVFSNLDLMRRNEFAHAGAAVVSVRVQDGHDRAMVGMTAADFMLTVNGTRRSVRLRPAGEAALTAHQPVVLLVFPPNQPVVHEIAVRDALRLFAGQPEPMPWKVGIFDANGTFLPFTGERRELLDHLAAVRVAKEPIQFTGYRFLPRGESTWQQKAEAAIANMAKSDGPRLIIAMNPLSEAMYGLNETGPWQTVERVGPVDLVAVAESVGAHIYVDNAGGPEVVVPGGDAAGPASLRGTVPSANNHIPYKQAAALNYFAFTNSLMMQTARETLGGFANGLGELTQQMQRDLDRAYVLEFEMTAQDQDKGVPVVEVASRVRQARLAMVDLAPLRVAAPAVSQAVSRQVGAAVLKEAMGRASNKPIVSADFAIHQRIEYFPVRGGAAPVLPMSCVVEWTGKGPRPEELAIAESVVDVDLSQPAMQREMEDGWAARSVRWERDGELRPGHYVWVVAVHDGAGKILASAKEPFTVVNQTGALAVSTLAVGSSCRADAGPAGLQRRPAAGAEVPLGLSADPLAVPGCRLVPAAADGFSTAETLRALVRIYPAGKLAKLAPEAWTGRFTLRGEDGGVEMSREAGFAVDPGSGLLAVTTMPLGDTAVKPGVHVLELEVRGPGIKQVMRESRRLVVAR